MGGIAWWFWRSGNQGTMLESWDDETSAAADRAIQVSGLALTRSRRAISSATGAWAKELGLEFCWSLDWHRGSAAVDQRSQGHRHAA